MRKLIFSFLLLILFIQWAFSQFTVKWEKTFGGLKSDEATSIVSTQDGGYIIAGGTSSKGSGGRDVWILKIDSNGNKLWEYTFGGRQDDGAYSIQKYSNGGFIIAGMTSSFGKNSGDVWLIKIDNQGKKLWDKIYGYERSTEQAIFAQQTFDSGFIIFANLIEFDKDKISIWLIKTDSLGNMLWNKKLEKSNKISLRVLSGIQTADSGYVLCGIIEKSGSSTDGYLIKTNKKGEILWEKTFGGPEYEEASSIKQTPDGGFIVAGRTWANGQRHSDLWLIKFNSSGQKQWERIFGDKFDDGGFMVINTMDKGFLTVGFKTIDNNIDSWIIKTDSIGNMELDQTFDGESYEIANAILENNDSSYIIINTKYHTNTNDQDLYIIKLVSNIRYSIQKTKGLLIGRVLPSNKSNKCLFYPIVYLKNNKYYQPKLNNLLDFNKFTIIGQQGEKIGIFNVETIPSNREISKNFLYNSNLKIEGTMKIKENALINNQKLFGISDNFHFKNFTYKNIDRDFLIKKIIITAKEYYSKFIFNGKEIFGKDVTIESFKVFDIDLDNFPEIISQVSVKLEVPVNLFEFSEGRRIDKFKNLLFILKIGNQSKTRVLYKSKWKEIFLGIMDIDDDGIAEILTLSHRYEVNEYHIYKLKKNYLEEVYTGLFYGL